ncbi:hypothetical protein Q4E93_00045 [Flavitalea sp. BT771]|uniref:hypothetical protein n=1 Tax=Flavitalea sp. BT771 TaxID=3063329 RepID=UPI0026E3ED44|nr:hypothetical protein [Flavitalea sp. BT771]MDO6428954.1 hypothetical protein [Flavitalea sp. BT771]MDV6218918.1 hypothetical protein [Flavitalea sp. BT771]
MNRILASLVLLSTLLAPRLTSAQQIIYSDPEREDNRRTNFEIIGKINGNYLVFKNNNSNNAICIYNGDMKLVQRVPLAFMPDKYINVDFVAYPDYFYMIYEHQHKSIVHCMAVKMDGMAKPMGEPMELDTTQIGFAANNKIYTTIASENKQKIMVFKINSKNNKNFLFTTLLYDAQLNVLDKHRMYLPMEERNELFTDFLLDNEGELVFGKFLRSGSNDYISRVTLVTKDVQADSFSVKDIGSADRILDEIKMKVDNTNRRFILTGFYYKQKRGNIEGLYTVVWDKGTNTRLKETVAIFNDELRALAKSSDANLKMAFNDFFIKNIIVKRDGGFLLISESLYTTSRGNMFNRWDYMYNPAFGPGFYSPYYYSPYYNPWNRNYGNYATRFHAENIMIIAFDKDGSIQWSNIIPKSQFDDESENLISYEMMNTGGELHFLFNQYERRNMLLNDQSISPEGKITRYPTLKNLDKGYDFMPRYGKQVSSWETIIPCLYRNYLCFAKVNF